MVKKIMICGIDCHPGDANCNNYCNHDTSKPSADCPPDATPEQRLSFARRVAREKLNEAMVAWYEYFCELTEFKGDCDDPHKAHTVFVTLRSAMNDAQRQQ